MAISDREILVCANSETVAREAARRFMGLAAASIQQRGRFVVALSGGTTPKRLYEILAQEPYRDRIDWTLVEFFWGDERFVDFTSSGSNYHMTDVALLSSLELNNGNVHRVRTELPTPEAAADAYEKEIQKVLQLAPGELPRFDLVLLGLGTNGHTASLFPRTKLLHESGHIVAAEYIEEVKQARISLTAPAINAGREIMFLVTGAEKADVAHEVLFGGADTERLPAQLIHPQQGTETWILDLAAASAIPKESFEALA